MRSIYEQVLGASFERLHPKIQQRFGFSSRDGKASIGRGVMQVIKHGPFYTWPFLAIGTWRNILFPQSGRDVPFVIENYAYKDSFGRETVTWVRTFQFPNRQRRFDATMIYSPQRQRIVDYLGTHQHLAVDIDCTVAANGGIRKRSGSQRFYEGWLGFKFPMLFSGYADVCEWYDDSLQKYRISVDVRNPVFGQLFYYEGTFEVEWVTVSDPAQIPAHVRPVREERRE